MNPSVTLFASNIHKIRNITSSNFLTTVDSFDEVAVTYEPGGPMEIHFVKPTDITWCATRTGLAGRPLQIAGGHFYKTSADSIAMITANSVGVYYEIYFYLPGSSSAFAISQTNNTVPFTAITGGRFDQNLTVDQVAVAGPVIDGVCQIGYYSAYQNDAYRYAAQKAIQTEVAVLSCGKLNIPKLIGNYERIEDFDNEQSDYASIVESWGAQTAVLLQNHQGHSIPIFWISNNPSDINKKYFKITPIVR
ncbi:MAG: hypothetical protein A2Y10_17745 [Planctomycetes bacterium GWF2_41_51]|nr:MAG: hypothetical protein A2Y10_17745 [Planctomycetes bacterium GWF2_41_51]HBG25906.1 hypothetical protein [Phycisphaerales bacterium]